VYPPPIKILLGNILFFKNQAGQTCLQITIASSAARFQDLVCDFRFFENCGIENCSTPMMHQTVPSGFFNSLFTTQPSYVRGKLILQQPHKKGG
ncbi:MAG: hypothetical protein LKG56_10955, partial [Lachnospiraceae bacterium]|nr:hypothetical protein [Lachnospiraceae bacterium]